MKKPEEPTLLEEQRQARDLARSLDGQGSADPDAAWSARMLREAGGEPSSANLARLGDELFPPRRRRWPAAVAAVLVLAAAGASVLRWQRAHSDVHARAERLVASLQIAATPAERAEAIARRAGR